MNILKLIIIIIIVLIFAKILLNMFYKERKRYIELEKTASVADTTNKTNGGYFF